MDKRLDLLEQKEAKVEERLVSIQVDLAEIKTDLKEHMRRTALVEEQNELIRESISVNQKVLETRLQPMEQWMDRIKFLGSVLIGIGTVIGFLVKLGLLRF